MIPMICVVIAKVFLRMYSEDISPCVDDENECTTNDIYYTDCNCSGTFLDTVGNGECDAIDIFQI